MKMQTSLYKVSTSNLIEQKSFQISNSYHTFKILSDGLYSDKITAILRELSCNAIDAHKAKGSTEPFIIHLPSIMDNTFYIKDFGIGMSHDDIMNNYSTYFYSNKTNTNEQIGGLGLGAKSPFSYTDSFLVESIFNNQKNTYNAFISETGCPAIVLLDSSLTTELNGVTVSFSVNTSDFAEFKSKLENVITHFDIKPIVKNCSDFKFKEVSYYLKKDRWGIRSGYDSFRSRIIMGGVAYPINSNMFKDNDLYFNIFHRSNIDIFFNIGDASVNPSRESLNYRKNDIEKIKEFVDQTIVADCVLQAGSAFASQDSLWKALCSFNEIIKDNAIIKDVIKHNNTVFRCGSHIINSNGTLDDMILIPDDMSVYLCEASYNRRKSVRLTNSRKIARMTPTKETEIIFDDMKIGGKSKIEYYIKNNHKSNRYIVNVAKYALPAYSKAIISSLFYGANIVVASELGKVPKKDVSTQVLKYLQYNEDKTVYGDMETVYASRETFRTKVETLLTSKQTILFSTTDKNGMNRISPSTIKTYLALRKLHLIGKITFVSVSLNGALHSILKEYDNVNVIDVGSSPFPYMKTMMNDYISGNNRRQRLFSEISKILETYNGSHTRSVQRFITFVGIYNTKTTPDTNKCLTDISVKMFKYKSFYERLKKVAGTDGIHLLHNYVETTENDNNLQMFINRYPLMQSLFEHCYDSSVEATFSDVLDYMNYIDNKTENG